MANNLIPTKIHTPKSYLIGLEWADGLSALVSLQRFRDECPCAACKGENIMGTVYTFPGMKMFKPGMFELEGINSSGNYAIQVAWKDGHNSGIYTWDILRQIAENFALSPSELAELEEKAKSEQE